VFSPSSRVSAVSLRIFDIRVENKKVGAGVRVRGDQPLWRWSSGPSDGAFSGGVHQYEDRAGQGSSTGNSRTFLHLLRQQNDSNILLILVRRRGVRGRARRTTRDGSSDRASGELMTTPAVCGDERLSRGYLALIGSIRSGRAASCGISFTSTSDEPGVLSACNRRRISSLRHRVSICLI